MHCSVLLVLLAVTLSTEIQSLNLGGPQSEQLREMVPRSDYSEKQCTREGLMCKDCKTLVSCKSTDYGFTEDAVLLCPEYAPCDDSVLACVPQGTCRYKKFECPPNTYDKEELFPDPYTCVKYHGCQGGMHFKYTCDEGSAYNPADQSCTLAVDNEACKTSPLELCARAGQNGTLDSYSYKCLQDAGPPNTLYPRFFSP